MCVNSIELDDGQSDAESVDSMTDVFTDIPLPSPAINTSEVTSPSHCISTNSSSPKLDAIPLPKSTVHEKPVADSHLSLSPSANVGNAEKPDSASKAIESSSGIQSGDAVHAKTSVGTITVLLNRKLGPRVNKASIFDVPDDNSKEVNRKLLKLRRLKRMKKNKDGQIELDGGSSTGRKALQQRISEWKEELLNDQNFKSKRDSKAAFDTAATNKVLPGNVKDKQSNMPNEDHKTEAKDNTSASLASSGIKTEAVDSKVVPNLKSDDLYVIKLYDSFMKVMSSNDAAQFDWPREMIQETKLAPKLVYSCNPLYFNFQKLHSNSHQNGDGKVESKKHKHQKKRKKSRAVKAEDHAAASKDGHTDTGSLDVNKDRTDSRKNLKNDSANRSDVTKEHAKISKNSSDCGILNKKSKKRKFNSRSMLSSKHKPIAEDTSQKRVSGSNSKSIPMAGAEDDSVHLSSTVKETGKSRWDTSSDSEPETKQPSPSDRKTREAARSRVVASSDQTCARTWDRSLANRSRSRSSRSSDSSARSHRRSRYRTTSSSSASSYSHSSCSYRSSSYSCRRHHRRQSSRSSCSYTASDYSRSSRSYSRSRSISRRRHWHSRSYSRSARSRSFTPSRSPPRRGSGRRLRPRPHKASSHWRAPIPKRLHVEQTKPSTQPAKASNKNTGADTKNNTDIFKPSAAEMEPADGATNSTVVTESKPVDAEKESKEAATDPAIEDVKSIPTPEEHMQSIPLPVPEHPAVSSSQSFIGPVLPSDHPLADKQDIPLPPTAKFQRIGPNDPLVFRRMPPPPPPPALLSGHSRVDADRPPSPPADEMEDDIAGDEDPIPQMLDMKTLKPAMFIPPEQDEQYGALRRQAELHARRQRIREETGMDIADDDEDEDMEAPAEDQLADQAYLDDAAAAAMFPATPVIHLPQQQLVGQPLSTSVAMVASGAGLVPMQIITTAGGGLVGLEPSMVSLVQQGQSPTVMAVSPAAAALARAQEEAEAEAQIRQQVAAAQAIAAAQQRQRAAELIQLLPGHMGAISVATSPALTALRTAGLSLQAVPVHAIASNQQPQQQLIQLPSGGIVGIRNIIPGGMQVLAQPQPQPAPLVIGPNGTILRLIR